MTATVPAFINTAPAFIMTTFIRIILVLNAIGYAWTRHKLSIGMAGAEKPRQYEIIKVQNIFNNQKDVAAQDLQCDSVTRFSTFMDFFLITTSLLWAPDKMD
jgi:hypothetical protein